LVGSEAESGTPFGEGERGRVLYEGGRERTEREREREDKGE